MPHPTRWGVLVLRDNDEQEPDIKRYVGLHRRRPGLSPNARWKEASGVSFFFDVWTSQGFVLASDVRLIVNGEPGYAHKLAMSGPKSRVNCAIAVCGEYPRNCLGYFHAATLTKDTLREVAEYFASRWVERYAGTEEYSAVHLVGFERVGNSDTLLPQMWFWSNWTGRGYHNKETLERQLNTFSEPIPHNNHIPHKVKQLTERFPGPTLEEESSLVTTFLKLYEPYFTWNGDTGFWRSAADAVGSALNLLKGKKPRWTLAEISDVTSTCLEFLIKVGNLLPDSTVGLSREGDFDVLQVTPKERTWITQANIEE
jgi:hypothetical protein